MQLSGTLLFVTLLLVSTPGKAEIAEISNPLWKEVPDTLLADADEQFDSPAYVDVNGVIWKGDIITYDMVNPDASYTRVETNCQSNQFRAIRLGEFISETRIKYISRLDPPWSIVNEPGLYHLAVMRFVCNLDSGTKANPH